MAWRELTAIWEQRTPTLPASHLFTYFGYTYTHSQAAGIRRVGDTTRDVQSLARLLMDIGRHPTLLSREFVVGRYKWGHQWTGDNYFTTLDPHGTGHVDRALVKRDTDVLASVVADIKKWANEHVAHLAKTPTSVVPTFSRLDEALDAIEELWQRWTVILTGNDLLSIEPVPQYDWLAPLRVPWIVSDDS
ncbi:MAG: hypothetical protein ACYDHU_11685 [Acidimicrobiales bacterium]